MRRRWIRLAVVLAALGVTVWAWRLVGGPRLSVDLLQEVGRAQKRSAPLPVSEAVGVVSVTINGDARRCLLQQSQSRVTFTLVPPPDAWFSTAVAMDPATWALEGDGALFRVGVSDGRVYEELLSLVVDPVHAPADRRWIPVSLDLSPWSGRKVDLILNVGAGAPRGPGDVRNDRALWAAPLIYSGR